MRLSRPARYIAGGNAFVNVEAADRSPMARHLGAEAAANEWAKAPLRRVSVHSFVLDECAVARREFLDFVASLRKVDHSRSRAIDFDYWEGFESAFPYADDAPIVSVSFAEASVYAWFHGGRLPTEEEWELAARGRSARSIDEERVLAARRWNVPVEEREGTESLLGLLKPVDDGASWTSPFGIKGMVGNADEWVDSVFDIRETQMAARGMFPDAHWGARLLRAYPQARGGGERVPASRTSKRDATGDERTASLDEGLDRSERVRGFPLRVRPLGRRAP